MGDSFHIWPWLFGSIGVIKGGISSSDKNKYIKQKEAMKNRKQLEILKKQNKLRSRKKES